MPDNSWILTYTGKKFFPLSPNPDDVDISDIAHALSNLCRFTGHVREFYSVAQHSVLVAERVQEFTKDTERTLHALLHAASEAYLCDVARPVKHSTEFHVYRSAEEKLQRIIERKFGIDVATDDEVKKADEYLLRVEAYFLMPDHPDWSWTTEKPWEFDSFETWTPTKAKEEFLHTFNWLLRGSRG